MNCSAQLYSTRFTVNGERSIGKKTEGAARIGAVCHVKWYEVWAYRLRSPNGGGGDRPRPFIIIAIWAQALCWPRIAEIPLQGLVSAVALVLCIHFFFFFFFVPASPEQGHDRPCRRNVGRVFLAGVRPDSPSRRRIPSCYRPGPGRGVVVELGQRGAHQALTPPVRAVHVSASNAGMLGDSVRARRKMTL